MKQRQFTIHKHSTDVPVKNPFVHRLNLGTVDVIKIGLMSFTIAPIRVFIAGILLILAWSLAAVSLLFQNKEERQKPLIGWRNVLRPLIVILCRAVFFAGGFHWISVKGTRARTEEAPIIALAPHSSYFDALPVVYLDLTTVVAKSEAELVPFFGKLIQFTQPVFVSREDPNSRINTIKEIKKRAHSKGAWPQVVIFPEGTCTNRSCLIGFKPGGFYPGVPVQPVCVRYPNKLDTITWTWDGPEAFKVLWYTLCQFHNYVEIEFLPVHVPNEDEVKDARLFAENVRRRMAICLDCAVTNHSYDDCRLMLRAAKLNIPASKGIIELHKMHKSLGVSFDAMKDLLEKCYSHVLNQSIDAVNLQEFADYLDVPKSENVQKLFNFYNQVESGKIDFREYVVSLCLVSGPASVDDTVKMMFQLFENRQKGFVSSNNLSCIFKHMFRMTHEETQQLFLAIDSDNDGQITYDELRNFARSKPECNKLFSAYQDHCNGLPNLCALDDTFLGSKYE